MELDVCVNVSGRNLEAHPTGMDEVMARSAQSKHGSDKARKERI